MYKFNCKKLNIEISIIPKFYVLEYCGSVSFNFQQAFPLSKKKTIHSHILFSKNSSLVRSPDMAIWQKDQTQEL